MTISQRPISSPSVCPGCGIVSLATEPVHTCCHCDTRFTAGADDS